MSFSFTFILSYFTFSICSLYFEIRSAFCLTGNRNAKWHNLNITETSPYKINLRILSNGGNLGLVLKMKNIDCLSILLTKHAKCTYLYLFKFVLYSIVAFKAN